MEHVGIVVGDLAAATAFFVELGLKLEGEGPVEGGSDLVTRRDQPREPGATPVPRSLP